MNTIIIKMTVDCFHSEELGNLTHPSELIKSKSLKRISASNFPKFREENFHIRKNSLITNHQLKLLVKIINKIT